MHTLVYFVVVAVAVVVAVVVVYMPVFAAVVVVPVVLEDGVQNLAVGRKPAVESPAVDYYIPFLFHDHARDHDQMTPYYYNMDFAAFVPVLVAAFPAVVATVVAEVDNNLELELGTGLAESLVGLYTDFPGEQHIVVRYCVVEAHILDMQLDQLQPVLVLAEDSDL